MEPLGEAAAAERAARMAELEAVINKQQALAWRLAVADGGHSEARRLHVRLQTIRLELDALRRGSWAAAAADAGPVSDLMRLLRG